MGSFKCFVEQQDFIEFALTQFNETAPSMQADPSYQTMVKPKVWSAKKPEILQMWRNLRPDMPIILTPVSDDPSKQSNYGEDGIRVTGSWQFIASVLGRIKDIMAYENPQTKLRLAFREVDKSRLPQGNRQSFVFYVNLEKRSRSDGQPAKIHPASHPVPGAT